MSKHLCAYCETWLKAPVVKRSGEDSKSGSFAKRNCPVIRKVVISDQPGCEYFNPMRTFFCDSYHHRTSLMECLNRRRNVQGFKQWKPCVECRQFERDIRSIIEEYYLEQTKVVPPPKQRKIRRRAKAPDKKKKRKIKRREKPARKIKRRKKVDKPKRKIRRRKK